MKVTQGNHQAQEGSREVRLTLLCFVAFAIYLTSGFEAYAGGLQAVVEDIYDQARGVAKILSHLAVFALGVGAVFGRIDVKQALVVAVGITIANHVGDMMSMVKGDVRESVVQVDAQAYYLAYSLGVIGIIVVGYSTMFGRMTMVQAVTTAVGIAILSGYQDIANIFSN